MHARVVLGVGKGVLFREVSSVQGCPYREGFHCTQRLAHTHTCNVGFGTLTERDGACYEGEFHGNRRHGEGSQVYANGDQFKGDWVRGQRHGHGVLRCTNGTTYEVIKVQNPRRNSCAGRHLLPLHMRV